MSRTFPKAKPQKYKNPDGYVWRPLPGSSYCKIGFLPTDVIRLLKPTMQNPEHSPTGLWYNTEAEALADLRRVEAEIR